ncbi:MAG TPA: BBP7 family outer membrane beta-barrel protein [Planctomycetia bacterium]|nr:BBP7 family outer membrane beta-barrel protein [Planctomycetia bacterium]
MTTRKSVLAFGLFALASAGASGDPPILVEGAPPILHEGSLGGAPAIVERSNAPLLYGRVEAMFMWRSAPDKVLLGSEVSSDTGATLRTVTAGDYQSDGVAGARVTLGRYLCNDKAFEVSWLGIERWVGTADLITDSQSAVFTTTPISPFGFVVEEGATAGGIINTASTRLHWLQAGIRKTIKDDECGVVSWFAGPYWMYFRDRSETTRSGSQDSESYSFDGSNQIFGGVAGLDLGKRVGFLILGVRSTGGIGANWNTLKGSYSLGTPRTDIAPVSFLTEDSGSSLMGVWNLGLYMDVQWTQQFKMHFGYDFYVMTGILQGSEQVQPTLAVGTVDAAGVQTVVPGRLSRDVDGTLFLNGLSVGFEFIW